MPANLKLREPTGKIGFPLLVVDGFEKSGKSIAALKLSMSPLVGQSFVMELGERTADEYASVGRYKIIDHNGTWSDMYEQIEAVTAIPAVDGKPNLFVFDGGTALNDMLSNWITKRARSTRDALRTLASDPDAAIKVGNHLYNEKNSRFDAIVDLLRDWPGIAVIVCHGKDVTPFANGAPVANAPKEYKVDTREYLLKQMTGRIHMGPNYSARLVQARSLVVRVPGDGIELPNDINDNPLEHVIFKVLKAGDQEFSQTSTAVKPSDGIPKAAAKNNIMGRFAARVSPEQAKQEASDVWWKFVGEGNQEPTDLSDDQWTALVNLTDVRMKEITGNNNEAPSASGAPLSSVPEPSEADLDAPAAPETPAEEPKAEHPPIEVLRVICEELQLDAPTKLKVCRQITGRRIAAFDKMSEDHARTCISALDEITPDALAQIIKDATAKEQAAKKAS